MKVKPVKAWALVSVWQPTIMLQDVYRTKLRATAQRQACIRLGDSPKSTTIIPVLITPIEKPAKKKRRGEATR